MKITLFLIVNFLVIALYGQVDNNIEHQINFDELVISFGSCNANVEQEYWKKILEESPDLWVWLGDNVYMDRDTKKPVSDPKKFQDLYDAQKGNINYSNFQNQVEIIGIWDDHDYGQNDGGADYGLKKESQTAFLDFLDVPKTDVRRTREGIYTSYLLTKGNLKVKLFLLDTRYFNDKPKTLLGNEQWDWLENQLNNSEADVHVFASGIQFLSEEHKYEKWADYENEKSNFYELIKKQGTVNPIFITGDRHRGEISKSKGDSVPIVYDITSSSLTSTIRSEEENRQRVGKLVQVNNYGLLRISKDPVLEIVAELKSINDKTEVSTLLDFK